MSYGMPFSDYYDGLKARYTEPFDADTVGIQFGDLVAMYQVKSGARGFPDTHGTVPTIEHSYMLQFRPGAYDVVLCDAEGPLAIVGIDTAEGFCEMASVHGLIQKLVDTQLRLLEADSANRNRWWQGRS